MAHDTPSTLSASDQTTDAEHFRAVELLAGHLAEGDVAEGDRAAVVDGIYRHLAAVTL